MDDTFNVLKRSGTPSMADKSTEQEGPALTDERGELDYKYLSCACCKWRRVHDGHYFYCRKLGDQSLADFVSVYSGGMKRLYSYPRPDSACPFLEGRNPLAQY